jgi:2-polyprenyl-3-methyl-5-hydroxy-6-metoxy-1,4-benzoquinol methylase
MTVDNKTINQFGEQWTTYQDTEGYFGSVELFKDFIQPFDTNKIKDKICMDIGAGTGRFTVSMLECGAKKVYSVEPSKAFEIIKHKVPKENLSKVEVMNTSGDKLNLDQVIDYAFSIGVMHHIPQVDDVVNSVYKSLKPGGQFVIWLYGKEGNELYLLFALPLRAIVKHLPLQLKSAVAFILNIFLTLYLYFCKAFHFLPLPIKSYMLNVMGKCNWDKRKLVIVDQLNPNYAKYYTKKEAQEVLERGKFKSEVFARHGYSWVVIGTKS